MAVMIQLYMMMNWYIVHYFCLILLYQGQVLFLKHSISHHFIRWGCYQLLLGVFFAWMTWVKMFRMQDRTLVFKQDVLPNLWTWMNSPVSGMAWDKVVVYIGWLILQIIHYQSSNFLHCVLNVVSKLTAGGIWIKEFAKVLQKGGS